MEVNDAVVVLWGELQRKTELKLDLVPIPSCHHGCCATSMNKGWRSFPGENFLRDGVTHVRHVSQVFNAPDKSNCKILNYGDKSLHHHKLMISMYFGTCAFFKMAFAFVCVRVCFFLFFVLAGSFVASPSMVIFKKSFYWRELMNRMVGWLPLPCNCKLIN